MKFPIKKAVRKSKVRKDGFARAKPRDLEHPIQVEVFSWAKMMLNFYPMLKWMYAIPNGGFRDIRTAKRLKAEGVKKGVPDICLPYPSKGFHGLYIEMKSAEGETSDSQDDWIDYLKSVGYFVAVCFSFIEARNVLIDYLPETGQNMKGET